MGSVQLQKYVTVCLEGQNTKKCVLKTLVDTHTTQACSKKNEKKKDRFEKYLVSVVYVCKNRKKDFLEKCHKKN